MNKVLDKFFTKADNGTVRLYDYDVTHLWLAGLVYAHIGYWVENLFRLVSKGVLDSRNQLLPFLFCYTIAMWAMYLALGTTNHPRFFSHRVLEGNTRRIKYWHGSTILLWCSCLSFSARSWWAAFLSRCPASPCGITAASPCM